MKFVLIILITMAYNAYGANPEQCLQYQGNDGSRVNTYNKLTYYRYVYRNVCTADIRITWSCEKTGTGSRKIRAGEKEVFEYPCGQSGLDITNVESTNW